MTRRLGFAIVISLVILAGGLLAAVVAFAPRRSPLR